MKAAFNEKFHFDETSKCCGGECSGELFPDLLNLEINKLNRGRVFGVLVESCGVGIQNRKVVIDKQAWERCSQSPGFNRCLELSMAKLALQQALRGF